MFHDHAARQALAPDRIQLASHRELDAIRRCFPAGKSRRSGLASNLEVQVKKAKICGCETGVDYEIKIY